MNVERYFRIHWVVKEITGPDDAGGANEQQKNKLNLFEHAIIDFYYCYYTQFYNFHQHIACFYPSGDSAILCSMA